MEPLPGAFLSREPEAEADGTVAPTDGQELVKRKECRKEDTKERRRDSGKQ